MAFPDILRSAGLSMPIGTGFELSIIFNASSIGIAMTATYFVFCPRYIKFSILKLLCCNPARKECLSIRYSAALKYRYMKTMTK